MRVSLSSWRNQPLRCPLLLFYLPLLLSLSSRSILPFLFSFLRIFFFSRSLASIVAKGIQLIFQNSLRLVVANLSPPRLPSTMAETTTAPAAAPVEDKAQQTNRPTRPDEGVFQKALVEAEKVHKAAMDRLVSGTTIP